MIKGFGKKEKNILKWVLIGLLALAVLFFAFNIFFTGDVVNVATNSITCKRAWQICPHGNSDCCAGLSCQGGTCKTSTINQTQTNTTYTNQTRANVTSTNQTQTNITSTNQTRTNVTSASTCKSKGTSVSSKSQCCSKKTKFAWSWPFRFKTVCA